MTGDGIGLGDGSDDSPWSPGSDVRFDHPAPQPFGHAASDEALDGATRAAPDPSPTARASIPGRRRRGPILAAVAVVAVAVAVFVANDTSTSPIAADLAVDTADSAAEVRPVLGRDVSLGQADAPLIQATGDCVGRRLPVAADPLWSVEVGGSLASPAYVGADAAFVVVGRVDDVSGETVSEIVALDVVDGTERWRTGVSGNGGRIAGVVDGVVVLNALAPDADDQLVAGFDATIGAPLWSIGVRAGDRFVVDPFAGLVVAESPPASATDVGEVRVLDPQTGRLQATSSGVILDIGDGRVTVLAGSKVIRVDGEQPSELVGVVGPAYRSVAVVGDAIVTADDDPSSLTVGSLASGDPQTPPSRLPLSGSGSLEPPRTVIGLDGLGDSAVLVTGDGALHGANVGPRSIEVRWRVDGSLIEMARSDRGRILLVSSQGGAVERVVDASTGRRIIDVAARSGSARVAGLAANGALVQGQDERGDVRVALDLDGAEMWSIPGATTLGIGDGVVVDATVATTPDATVTVSAYGAVGGSSPGCTRILERGAPDDSVTGATPGDSGPGTFDG